MYCTQCGVQNDTLAKICSQCHAALYRPNTSATPKPQTTTIPSYLVQSILVTLCCCLVPGIVAIVYAAQVNGLIQAGDFAGARRCSKRAYIWSWIGFGLSAGFAVLYLLVVVIVSTLSE